MILCEKSNCISAFSLVTVGHQ